MKIKVQAIKANLCWIFLNVAIVVNAQSPSLRGNGMGFVENKGQIVDMDNRLRPDILYVGDGAGTKIYLRKGGISYVTTKTESIEDYGEQNLSQSPNNTSNEQLIKGKQGSAENITVTGFRVDVDFVGGNTEAKIVSSDKVEGYFNYYLGHCSEGVTNVWAYNKVVYRDVYPNIDIAFYGNKENRLKYDFIVKPGGNPNDIEIQYSGADDLRITNRGELKIVTSLGQIKETMPRVYQNIDGKIVDVKAKYNLTGTTLNFKLGTFNPQYPLVVDPWITYYGGNDDDHGKGITTDPSGNVLVTGMVYSGNFPVTAGVFQTRFGGPLSTSDAYVVKFNSAGVRQWSTFFGGSGSEMGWGIAIDANSNCVVTGWTTSANFPFSFGALQTTRKGNSDAYVFKLDPAGARSWATYFGGNAPDSGGGICVDINNNILFTGETSSIDFPVSVGAYQTNNAGINDVFVTKFDPNGSLLWSTYYGGIKDEFGRAITTDALGNVGVVGVAYANFPVSPGAYQAIYAGFCDAFVLKLDANGNRMWATYYGGSSVDAGNGIVADRNNNLIIVGYTSSGTLPTTLGTAQPVYAGGTDAFVAKFSSAGGLAWATFYGGSSIIGGGDQGHSIDLDANDNIFISGCTYSTDLPISSCAYQTTNVGSVAFAREDIFIAKFDTTGNLLCNTYLGGPGHDEQDGGNQIALHYPYVYITGLTPGSFPVTAGAQQTTYAGGQYDVFVAQLCAITCGNYSTAINFSPSQTNVCIGSAVDFLSNVGACDTTGLSWAWYFQGGNPATSSVKNPTGIVYNTIGNFSVKLIVSTPCGIDSLIQNNIVVSPTITTSITGNANICNGNNTTLSASNGNSYLWSTGATTATITVNPGITTSYTVIAYNGLCYGTSIITVSVTAIPVADAGNDVIICEGDLLALSASGGLSYSWSTGASTSVINVSPVITTTYVLTAFNGTCPDDDTVRVIVNSLPVAIAGNDTTIHAGSAIVLTAHGSSGEYSWYPYAGLSCVTCQNPTATPLVTTTYYVIVTDANGCTNIDSLVITVEIICGNIFVPNAFSPNGDGQNDVLFVMANKYCIESIVFLIYNRWGEKVFETSDINKNWDGTYRGQLMNTGVFSYIIRAKFLDGEDLLKKGNISLIR